MDRAHVYSGLQRFRLIYRKGQWFNHNYIQVLPGAPETRDSNFPQKISIQANRTCSESTRRNRTILPTRTDTSRSISLASSSSPSTSPAPEDSASTTSAWIRTHCTLPVSSFNDHL